MFQTELQKAKNKFKNRKYVLENIYIELNQFHEVAGNTKPYDLGKSLFVFQEIVIVGQISDLTANVAKNFVKLVSKQTEIDLKQLTELHNINNTIYVAKCNFPTTHNTALEIEYDLSNFLFDAVYWASVKGVLITSL